MSIRLRRRSSPLIGLFVFAFVVVAIPLMARGGEVPVGDATEEQDAEKEARRLFAQGQTHYSLGEYEDAIADFRRAYELSSAAGLLFNIAQAHRLNGQCRQAIEVYRHFVRLVPTSDHRAEAETQIALLTPTCGAPAASATVAPGPAAKLDGPAPTVPEPAPRWSKRKRASGALLAVGVATGLAAGIVYRWNSGRYDDWQSEDRRLAAATRGTSGDAWMVAQQRNDALLDSIHRADTVNVVLAGVSVVAVFTAAVLLILER